MAQLIVAKMLVLLAEGRREEALAFSWQMGFRSAAAAAPRVRFSKSSRMCRSRRHNPHPPTRPEPALFVQDGDQ